MAGVVSTLNVKEGQIAASGQPAATITNTDTVYIRINVVENPEELIFTNLGHFIPETVDNAIHRDAPEEFYRNRFLVNAMVNLNMIDTIGSGIKKMFIEQRKRYFPLPDFDLSDPGKVIVKIYGKILNYNYSRILINNMNLDLGAVIALDKVQKKYAIAPEELKVLRRMKLVEGRLPNLYVSAVIAEATGEKESYIRNKAFDKDFYKKMVISYLRQYGFATRQDIDELLLVKMSDALDEQQKRRRIGNILQEMAKKEGTIENSGSKRFSKWKLKN